jgi:hypothetical protein
MAGAVNVRKSAALILALWVVSTWGASIHVHHCCDEHRHEQQQEDDLPCSICIAVQQVPLIALSKAETFERERDVVAFISPWIALIPADVFYDRPLARGPPRASGHA